MTKEDRARLAALEAAIAVEEKAIAKLQNAMAGLTADAEGLNAALQGVGGTALKKQRALVDTLQQVGHWQWSSVEGGGDGGDGAHEIVFCSLSRLM